MRIYIIQIQDTCKWTLHADREADLNRQLRTIWVKNGRKEWRIAVLKGAPVQAQGNPPKKEACCTHLQALLLVFKFYIKEVCEAPKATEILTVTIICIYNPQTFLKPVKCQHDDNFVWGWEKVGYVSNKQNKNWKLGELKLSFHKKS